MGTVTILNSTTKNPITLIGEMAGICWGADVSNQEKNYNRGLNCLSSEHGRTWEFPDVYAQIDGYSARVIREWYTHIGGAPTRLQASTRYINYEKGFNYVTPVSITANNDALIIWEDIMDTIQTGLQKLEDLGIPREDNAMALPLAMQTSMVDKRNFRNIADMSGQRMCSRAYWEYRALFNDYKKALSEYSEEWAYLCEHYMMPKCKKIGFCKETKSCGLMPKK